MLLTDELTRIHKRLIENKNYAKFTREKCNEVVQKLLPPQLRHYQEWKMCQICGDSYKDHECRQPGWFDSSNEVIIVRKSDAKECQRFKGNWSLDKNGKVRKHQCCQCGKMFRTRSDAEKHILCPQPRYNATVVESWTDVRKVDYQKKELYDKASQDKIKIEEELQQLH